MTFHLRARFDGRVLIPDQPVDLPLNQMLEVEVSSRGPVGSNGAIGGSINGAIGGSINGAGNGEHAPSPEVIRERLRKLDDFFRLPPLGSVPLEALRRENLYDDRL